jgi:LacI family transcriptional regulator
VGEAKALTQRLLTGRERPTAIVCGNDIIAHGALFGAQSVGRRVPRDLSVVGIGDFRLSAHIEPGLSTIRIPAPGIGRAAADAIMQLIQGAERIPRVLIEPELRIRGSSGPPPGADIDPVSSTPST